MFLSKYKLLFIGGTALFSLGLGAGTLATHIVYRGIVAELKLEHSRERESISEAKSKYYEGKLEEWRVILAQERAEVIRLNSILQEERKVRSSERKEFEDALAESNLSKCDARGVASVLRKKVDRERSRHSRPEN